MKQYTSCWVENLKIFTLSVLFALLLLLLDKSDFGPSFGGKEALCEDKPLPPVTVFVPLIFIKCGFEILQNDAEQYDFRENQFIEIYIIYLFLPK